MPALGQVPMSNRYLQGHLELFRQRRGSWTMSGRGLIAAVDPSAPGSHQETWPEVVVYSTLAPAYVLAVLSQAYAIDEPAGCQMLQRGLNDTYLLTTSNRRFIARIYRAARPQAEIRYELDLLTHLDNRGVHVASPLTARDGSLVQQIIAPEGMRNAVLFSHASGARLSWDNEEHCRLVGRAAAAMHAASVEFTSAHSRRWLDLGYLIDQPVTLIKPFLVHRPADWRYLEELAFRVRARIAAIAPVLDWGPCHGDFGANNAHISEDGRVTLFDFDFCGPGWRPYDLVAPWRISDGNHTGAIWESFLRGYTEIRALSPLDLRALPLFDVAARMRFLGLRAEHAPESGIGRMDDDHLHRALSSLRYWDDKYGAAGVGTRSRERRAAEDDRMNVHEPPARRPEHRPARVPLPVTYSILSSDALGQKIVDDFDVPTEVSCELVRPGSNDTYLVRAGRGEYVARIYGSQWRSLSEISYELDLLIHLASRGVHVSLPIPGRDGARIRAVAAPEGLRYLVLFTRAPGKPLSWVDRDQCALAGNAAAAIHRATDDFVSEHERFRLDLGYLIDAPLSALRPFLTHRSADWRYVEQLAEELRERALAAIADGLDWGVCHGDLGNQNIYVSAEGELTVIDFDLAGPGWRAYDFVAAQWLSSYDNNSHVWQAFLDGYTCVRSLGPADLAAVDVFHGISRLWTVGLDARNAPRWGTLPMSDYYLDSYLRSLREWEREFGGGA
jgi:Ser/Thr protein kinase RdoA (MazF antagonist)